MKAHACTVPKVTESRTKDIAQTTYVHRKIFVAHIFVRQAPIGAFELYENRLPLPAFQQSAASGDRGRWEKSEKRAAP
jgi:hypothetical protein